MDRAKAITLLRDELNKHGLQSWKCSLIPSDKVYGLCMHSEKRICISSFHVDTHPDYEVIDTIKHEVAHALTPGHSHNETWKAMAVKLGAKPNACSSLGLSPEAIDAIRSGHHLEVELVPETVKTVVEETVMKPKYVVTRLQDLCKVCGKVAETDKEDFFLNPLEDGPDTKIIHLKCGHVVMKSIPKGTPFHKLIADADEHKTCEHEWDKNKCLKCGTFRPFDFQLEGMRFIERALATNKGAAVFDEMGLGKTIQALGYIKFHPEAWPVLYVVKSGIKFQWYQQILTWLGPEHAGQVLKGSKDWVIPGLKTYIISYDLLIPKVRKGRGDKIITQGFDVNKLIEAGIKTIVLDECQQIKNPDSSRTQQVRKLAKHMNVIALSGSPWKNRGSEFYSVLNMMAPMKFPSYQAYLDKWVDFYYDGKYTKEGGIKKPLLFKEYIKEIAIRRERTEVMKELPLVNRTKMPVELLELEQDAYDKAEQVFVRWYNDMIIGGDEPTGMNILAQMTHMRHLAGLAKIPATMEYIDEFVENTDRKIVVFAHHIDVQQILYENCKQKYGKDMPVFKLLGSTSSEDRFSIQQDFNKSERCIMIASMLAAGEGLNLQTCADCIMHERQWNPQNEEQAEGRFIRIGQTATSVNATYIQAADSIDSDFDVIVERKRVMFHDAMNKGEMVKWNQNDLIKELAQRVVDRVRRKQKAA